MLAAQKKMMDEGTFVLPPFVRLFFGAVSIFQRAFARKHTLFYFQTWGYYRHEGLVILTPTTVNPRWATRFVGRGKNTVYNKNTPTPYRPQSLKRKLRDHTRNYLTKLHHKKETVTASHRYRVEVLVLFTKNCIPQ